MITPYNLLRHELIGLKVCAKTKGAEVQGQVEAESAKTLKVKTEKGMKTLVKQGATFAFALPENAVVEVDGRLLVGRPADRIKKKQRIRF
ncbi:MAG: ribonuclease P protein subunit [Candidatus Altiarchaeota archaeon]|nr:ribonuclease P protein subunit [Candidatus Altiarchaeota archaeon]